MPYGDPDHTDPLTLHGVVVETDDPTCVQEMAACFIEEYLRSEQAEHPEKTEAEVIAAVACSYGAPE